MNTYRIGKSERIDYGGVTFSRYPESRQRSNRVYFVPDASARKEGIQALHVEIYKDNFGPIPEGYHVHHKDGNPLNNAPENLECLTSSAHAKEHVGDDHHAALRQAGRERFQHYQRQRTDWLKTTPEGQAVAKEEALKRVAGAAAARGESLIKCSVCGAETTRPNKSDGSPSLYCSDQCNQTAYRRRQGIGVAPHPYTCETCGKAGVTTRKIKKYCGRQCKSLGRKKK